jgi:hypothetical protein
MVFSGASTDLEERSMKVRVLGALAGAGMMALASSASAAVYIPGQFNGWNNNGPQMTETSPGSGVYTHSYSGQPALGIVPFALLSIGADWNSKYIPSGDQWVVADSLGGSTITFDTNTVNDGWLPSVNRVGSLNPETVWTAVGNWQSQVGGSDWTNNNPATTMLAAGAGKYSFSATLAPGTYDYKAVLTGTWNAIGADSRSVNASNVQFTTTALNNQVTFWVDASTGTVRVDVIPAPGAAALAGFGGLLAARRRR